MPELEMCDPVSLPTDADKRLQCGHEDCTCVAALRNMTVFRVYRPSDQKWHYWAFCTPDHALDAMPADFMPTA